MSLRNPRPFTPEDDRYLEVAVAEGVGYCKMAAALGRSVSSVQGRVKRLRDEPVRPSTRDDSAERP